MSEANNPTPRQSLTQTDITRFLEGQQAGGASANSIKRYRSDLQNLQRYLGVGGCIAPGTLSAWQTDMRTRGYAPRTVATRVTTINKYLLFCGKPELCQSQPYYKAVPDVSLTRPEYHRLLQVAQSQHNAQGELLLRLFAETGIPLQVLPQLTARAVRNGGFVMQTNRTTRTITLPEPLRSDLARYMRVQQIRSGPVFVTRTGKPMLRANVTLILQRLASCAGIPPAKCSPRCLQRLCTAYSPPRVAAARADTATQRVCTSP